MCLLNWTREETLSGGILRSHAIHIRRWKKVNERSQWLFVLCSTWHQQNEGAPLFLFFWMSEAPFWDISDSDSGQNVAPLNLKRKWLCGVPPKGSQKPKTRNAGCCLEDCCSDEAQRWSRPVVPKNDPWRRRRRNQLETTDAAQLDFKCQTPCCDKRNVSTMCNVIIVTMFRPLRCFTMCTNARVHTKLLHTWLTMGNLPRCMCHHQPNCCVTSRSIMYQAGYQTTWSGFFPVWQRHKTKNCYMCHQVRDDGLSGCTSISTAIWMVVIFESQSDTPWGSFYEQNAKWNKRIQHPAGLLHTTR